MDQSTTTIGTTGTVIGLVIVVFYLFCSWRVYDKAGQPGWASLIPIYNIVVLLRIVGRPLWWLLLLFVPLVNLVIAVLVNLDLAKRFGKGTGFGIGLILLSFVFIPILAFGEATYRASGSGLATAPA